jgi:hypothetical protein
MVDSTLLQREKLRLSQCFHLCRDVETLDECFQNEEEDKRP